MKRVLIYVAIAGVLGIAAAPPAAAQTDQIVMDSASIPKFVSQLPMLELAPDSTTGKWGGGLPVLDGTSPLTVSICEFQTEILPPGTFGPGSAAPKTWVWGYQIGDTCVQDPGHSFIGPVVVAQRHTPTQMTFINQLGDSAASNVLAYTRNTDMTLHWGDPLNYEENACSEELARTGEPPLPGSYCASNYSGPIAAAVHLHGGEIPPNLDGGPDSWFTGNGGYRGHGYYTRETFGLPSVTDPDFPEGVLIFNRLDDTYYRKDAGAWIENAPVDRATYVYPNTQEAANIWFHDHVLGFTRLNVYAGIAGAYVIQDPAETNPALGPVTNLVPLVIQDRFFDTNGELYFAGPGENTTPEHPYWVAEFIGDVAVVNGKAWPTMTVEPKRYRFLFLNGSNSRGYDLFLHQPAGIKPNGKPSKEKAGPPMHVIGTDGGYLDAPATINPRNNNTGNPMKLVLLPGERYEVIIDFSEYAGKTLEMQNTAWNPYPLGDAPPIGQIMQFQVTTTVTNDGMEVAYNPDLYDPADPTTSPRVTPIVSLAPLAAAPAVHRQLTLNEVASPITDNPLEALLNNSKWSGLQWHHVEGADNYATIRGDYVERPEDYVRPTYYSELPGEGTTEVWDVINITADAHPIHLHLVQFQILERIPVDEVCYNNVYNSSFPNGMYEPGYGPPADYNTGINDNGVPIATPGVLGGNPDPSQCPIAESFFGPRRGAEHYEMGWKDTAVMYPGEVTRLAVRWAPTDIPNTETSMANLGFAFDPDDGHGYVWHCHILDHEDNEMMRPTEVGTNGAFIGRTFIQGVDY